mmetsp:Transcript_13111/g.21625  ORF Transcript_13111/g.21625 Transcript_13111/m.21625 type:complete len:223 (-) Transcript_13111:146-814(-)|eukprot:CAMPEP_0169238216 /NCGR_PEP_ID=MMETSP1016-20121227/30221_1 /TAXON_ID=342587 /ORGANISM="Karlodinium micrum, Strain CCMP2283" /LENGTH=222 /DNA_ID=CAMNT_0009317991 /DNA_START=64 /DNA_END=732 /DNA_ORIENTATION=-
MGQGGGASCRTQDCHCTDQREHCPDLPEASAAVTKVEKVVRPDQYREELLYDEQAEATRREIESTREEARRNSQFFQVEASDHEAFFAKVIEEQRRLAEESRRSSEIRRTSSNMAEAELRRNAEKKISDCREQSQRLVEHAEEQRRSRETEATRQLQEAKSERLRLQSEAERQRAEAERERQMSLLEKQRIESTSKEPPIIETLDIADELVREAGPSTPLPY